MATVHALAVDIGGTKLFVGAVDRAGSVLYRCRAATPRGDDAEVLFAALVALVEQTVAATGSPAVVGVGVGGPMAPSGEHVSPLNIPAWRAFPLRARLAELVGVPTFVDNDAKALARAEGWIGAAAGERNFAAMVVSTGVGGGLVVDGRLLDGASGNAGHIGHVVVEPDGRRCPCGGRGCLEAETSGTSIRAAFGIDPADAPDAVRRRTGRLVGRAVASVVNLLDLRVVAVAGSVALGFGEPFFEAANEELALRSTISYTAGARIVPAGLGDDAPLVGAAAVGWAGLRSQSGERVPQE